MTAPCVRLRGSVWGEDRFISERCGPQKVRTIVWDFDSAGPGRLCLGWMSGDEPGDLAAGNLGSLGTVKLAGGTGWLVILALGGRSSTAMMNGSVPQARHLTLRVLWGVLVCGGFACLYPCVLQIPHTTLFAVKAPLPLVLMDSSSSECSGPSLVPGIISLPPLRCTADRHLSLRWHPTAGQAAGGGHLFTPRNF